MQKDKSRSGDSSDDSNVSVELGADSITHNVNKPVVNPRLIDAWNLPFTQDDVVFAIPHLKEDIHLYIDPFLLWASDNPYYQELHLQLLGFFAHLRLLVEQGRQIEALRMLLTCQEPQEMGLGNALGSKRGSTIGPKLAEDILSLYEFIPQLKGSNFNHIEEIQLFVPNIAEDRISDLTAAILKDFFVRFTVEQAANLQIPTKPAPIATIFDHERKQWRSGGKANLPFNPLNDAPLLFAPLDLLRHLPWINYRDYYQSYFAPYVLPADPAARKLHKTQVLRYNQANYETVRQYVREKERLGSQCRSDPLFEPLQLATLKRKLALLLQLPTGMEDENDKKYEELVCEMLSSLLYPELQFAQSQARTVSGAHIRDLIFYNDGKTEFTLDLRRRFDARQWVFELKNVKALERDHTNQLYRYLDEEIGDFGILVTRNKPSKAIERNLVDLHSSKRCVILCLDDTDIELMVNLLDSGRRPIEALKKKFVEFTRTLPK